MRTHCLLLIAVLGLQSTRASADAAAESQALMRVLQGIDRLESMLIEPEAAADPHDRIRFRYDWLRKDLELIRAGIQEHVDATHVITLPVEPLRGDYRR